LLTADPGTIVTRDSIMRVVWGHADTADATLGMHMTTLRRKLGVSRMIEAVRGVGSRFVT
jgi:DNA-binding response OmpR family regulator